MRLRTAVATISVGAAVGILIGLAEAALAIAANRYIQYGMVRLAVQALQRSLNPNLLVFVAYSGLVAIGWAIFARRPGLDEAKYARVALLLFLIVLAARILAWSSLPVDMLPLALNRTAGGILRVLRGTDSIGQFLSLFRRYVDALVVLVGGLAALVVFWRVSARLEVTKLLHQLGGKRFQVAAGILILLWLGVNAAVAIDKRFNPPGGPNVVLIGIDTLRADHLRCSGYDRDTTPSIDGLAENAAVFKSAISTSSWTLPSFLSIMTSLYQISHGVTDVIHRLDYSHVTLPEVLKDAGYTTAGFISGPLLRSLYGFNQGFDVYDESASSPSRLGCNETVTCPDIHRLVLDWLRKNSDRPFFLFVHYWDPHYDYIPPPPYDETFDPYYEGTIDGTDIAQTDKINPGMDPRDLEHIVALYDGEVLWTDWHVGRLFEALKDLGVWNNTIVVVVADHGEEFLEHGGKVHARTLYDEVIHVPLLFRFPGVLEAREFDTVVSIVDIAPTILEALEIAHPAATDGESLLPIIAGVREERSTTEVYSELKSDLVSLVSGPWKLIHHLGSDEYELYDTAEDRYEQTDLISAVPDRAGVLKQKLSEWLASKRAKAVTAPAATRDAKTTRELKALGYIQ